MTIPERDLGAAPDLVILLDYDGTLVSLVSRPELALLSSRRRAFLEALGRTAVVAVVTGRSLAEARRLVGLSSFAYIGNHGLEISYKGRSWVHPVAKQRRGDLAAVLRRIRTRTADLAGVVVEDKRLTAGIHYRLLQRAHIGRLARIVHEEIERRGTGLKVTRGKKVFEIRPKVDWDKGRGTLEFLSWLGPALDRRLIYIGDDRTDEDAFRALRGIGTTVRVGGRARSLAEFRLPGVGRVWALLKTISALRSE